MSTDPRNMTLAELVAHLDRVSEASVTSYDVTIARYVGHPAFLDLRAAAEAVAAFTGYEPEVECAAAVNRLADALNNAPQPPRTLALYLVEAA